MLFSSSVPCYLEKIFYPIFEELWCFYYKFEIIIYSFIELIRKKKIYLRKKKKKILSKKRKKKN